MSKQCSRLWPTSLLSTVSMTICFHTFRLHRFMLDNLIFVFLLCAINMKFIFRFLFFLEMLSSEASLNNIFLFSIFLTKQVTGTVALPCTAFNCSYFILNHPSQPRLIYLLRVPKKWEHRLYFANILFHFAWSCGRAVPSV